LREKLIPRIEFPRFVEKSENTPDKRNVSGIKPSWFKRNGKFNLEKIEKDYRFGIKISCCPSCGEFIADVLSDRLRYGKKSGLISSEEYDLRIRATVSRNRKTRRCFKNRLTSKTYEFRLTNLRKNRSPANHGVFSKIQALNHHFQLFL
jgi:hypothetical protein